MARQRRIQAGGGASRRPAQGRHDALGNSFRAGRRTELPHRQRLESLFGEDLGHLEVVTGVGPALREAGMDGAACEQRLVFADDNPSPELVAHEVTHGLQHEGASESCGALSRPGDSAEREAVAAEEAVRTGEPVAVAQTAGGVHGGWLSGIARSAWDAVKDVGRSIRDAVGGVWDWLTGGRDQEASQPAPTQAETPTQTAPTQTAPEQTAPTEAVPELEEDGPIDGVRLQSAADAVVAVAPPSVQDEARGSVPLILRNAAEAGLRNANQVAYILATTHHESLFGQQMLELRNRATQNADGTWSARVHVTNQWVSAPTQEALEVAYWNNAYGHRTDIGNRPGTDDGYDYRGRGYVQLTGRTNYEDMTRRLNASGFSYTHDGVTYGGEGNAPIDLLSNPDHTIDNESLAARILVVGMSEGSYTGRALDDYIGEGAPDFFNARRIVNGTDKADVIAGYAQTYAGALGGTWAGVFRDGPQT